MQVAVATITVLKQVVRRGWLTNLAAPLQTRSNGLAVYRPSQPKASGQSVRSRFSSRHSPRRTGNIGVSGSMRDTVASHGSGQKGWEDKMMKSNRQGCLTMSQHHWNQH